MGFSCFLVNHATLKLDGNTRGRALNVVLGITLLNEGFGEPCTL